MNKENLPDFITSPADVAEYMSRLQGLVKILEYLGGAESSIDKNALAYTFMCINGLVQEVRDMLFALDDMMKSDAAPPRRVRINKRDGEEPA